MDVFDRISAANARHAAGFDGTALGPRPVLRLAVLTCMDCRIDPADAFGLRPGDAHVLRNAGARVTDDVVRSLVASVHVLGVRHVAVVQHTGCGMHAADGDDAVRAALPPAARERVAGLPLLTFSDADAALAADVASLREHGALEGIAVAGFRYDVQTGKLDRLA